MNMVQSRSLASAWRGSAAPSPEAREVTGYSMKLEKIVLPEKPEGVSLSGFDCVWVVFGSRSDEPIRNTTLQWIDWKLQGQVSRYLMSSSDKKSLTTFIPTMRKLPVSFLALDSEAASGWSSFWNNCEGLKLKNVLLLCEDASLIPQIEKTLGARSQAEYPERLAMGSSA